MEFLQTIRKKSNATKSGYAFFIATFLTFVIAGIWVTALPARFAQIGSVDVTEAIEPNTAEEGSLGSLLGSSKEQLGAILDSVPIQNQDEEVFGSEDTSALTRLKNVNEENGTESLDASVSQKEIEVTAEEKRDAVVTVPQAVLPTSVLSRPTVLVPIAREPRMILIGTSSRNITE